MFYVGPSGKELSTARAEANQYKQIADVKIVAITEQYYTVGDYFKIKRPLQPEDIVSLLRDGYLEAAKSIIKDTGINVMGFNRNLCTARSEPSSSAWFKARGYKLHKKLSADDQVFVNDGSHAGVKYIHFTYVARKNMRQGDRLISDDMRAAYKDNVVFLCHCDQFSEVFPDLSFEPDVYLAYSHFFNPVYKSHIYYPTISVRTDDNARPEIPHCTAYLYAEKNISAFMALVTQRKNYIDAELLFTSSHAKSMIGVETYLCKIVR